MSQLSYEEGVVELGCYKRILMRFLLLLCSDLICGIPVNTGFPNQEGVLLKTLLDDCEMYTPSLSSSTLFV